ncbi:peptidylprolyl isomerase [Streptococcus marmotae]|uniref:peptidylprolyl isomerase n=1 Tax=Streptococcus marmotae TaxID=1825069 RepID=UPI000835B781|nr:peptidylprolyl isomerase [Streptococcus marmotae]
MLNKIKVRLLLGIGGIAVTSFLVMMGYTIGSHSATKQTEHQIKTEAHKLLASEKEKEHATVLSDELVKEFLTQYYTKEKMGENNNRIKPYMTDSAYKEEIAHQEESINQVYKDYLLDYRFDEAKIFVNSKTNEALVEVSYQVTYVSDMSEHQQKMTQTETKTMKVSYAKIRDQLLVNQLITWNGKFDDLKSNTEVSNSAIPDIKSTTTSDNN